MFLDQPPDCAEARAAMSAYRGGDLREYGRLMSENASCARLREAGWSAIEEVAAQGRQVRRAHYDMGTLVFRVPSVMLERSANGETTVSLRTLGRDGRVLSARVPGSAWRRLTAMDRAAEAPQPRMPPQDCAKGCIVGCHGDYATLEAAVGGGRSWRQVLDSCSYRADGPAFRYAFQLAQLAVDHIPECAPARAEADAADAGKPREPGRALRILHKCAGRAAPRTISNP